MSAPPPFSGLVDSYDFSGLRVKEVSRTTDWDSLTVRGNDGDEYITVNHKVVYECQAQGKRHTWQVTILEPMTIEAGATGSELYMLVKSVKALKDCIIRRVRL